MNERYLPICTHCYAVRVEPQRARALRPTCAACGEEITTPPQRKEPEQEQEPVAFIDEQGTLRYYKPSDFNQCEYGGLVRLYKEKT